MHTRCHHVWFIVTCFVLLCCSSSLKCEQSKNIECLNYQQINKENLRNCLENDTYFNAIQELEKLVKEQLDKKSWKFDLTDDLELKVTKMDNRRLDIKLNTKDMAEVERKMQKMSMKNMMPYMIVPGLVMAGLIPWVMPGIKMIVMGVSMVNQMVFNAALFGLIRSYVFDTEGEEHIVYVNHGYRPKHKPSHYTVR